MWGKGGGCGGGGRGGCRAKDLKQKGAKGAVRCRFGFIDTKGTRVCQARDAAPSASRWLHICRLAV